MQQLLVVLPAVGPAAAAGGAGSSSSRLEQQEGSMLAVGEAAWYQVCDLVVFKCRLRLVGVSSVRLHDICDKKESRARRLVSGFCVCCGRETCSSVCFECT
jgi:hypothetical protein